MDIGIVGLGRMGANIARRLMRAGHSCVVYDRNKRAVDDLAKEGGRPATSLADLISQLPKPCAVWLMLPAGAITQSSVDEASDLLQPQDALIDGGNTFYKDDIRRAEKLEQRQVHYIDVGTSGGVWGLERGYCMMIGGPADVVRRLDPIFAALAPGIGSITRTEQRHDRDPRVEQGYMHCGPAGSGHFVKMVHNGIEYGLMQAYAEGFDIIRNKLSEALPTDQRFAIDTADVAEVWRRGSVVSSWLLDLCAIALAKNADLSTFSGAVSDSGEGRWTLEAAVEEAVAAPVLAASLFARFRSRADHTFGEKLLSAMRYEFGGHVESGGH